MMKTDIKHKSSFIAYSYNALLVCLLVLSAPYARAQTIGVMLNGSPVTFQGLGPQQIQGRVLVPVRGVLERLGAQVGWDQATQTVVASNGKVDIQLKIGDRNATVNGNTVQLDVPAQVIAGSTFVPLRFLGEALGADVGWNQQTRTVLIRTGGHLAQEPPPVSSGPAPVINSLTFSGRDWLRAGDTIRVMLAGTPGCQATFRIPGLIGSVPMQESSPGRYIGYWQVPGDRPLQLIGGAVIGRLVGNGQTGTLLQAAQPISVNTVPPRIRDLSPGQGVHVCDTHPTIYAVFDASSCGIALGSVRLLVDGRDVTPISTITRDFVSFNPDAPLPPGPTAIEIRGSDIAGNRFDIQWSFIEDIRTAAGITSLQVNADHDYQVGEVIHVLLSGAPGCSGFFSLGSITNIPLQERSAGRYEASYTIRPGDDVSRSRLVARLRAASGNVYEQQSSRAVTIITGAPATPIITYPGPDDRVSSPVVIQGKGTPNTRVKIHLAYKSNVVGVLSLQGSVGDFQARVDGRGNWQTSAFDLANLFGNRGIVYTATAVSANVSGQQSGASSRRFQIR